MEDKTAPRQASAPDPATSEESNVIGATMRGALQALRKARRIVLAIRPSDDTREAVRSLEGAQRDVEGFLWRED
jgi:hypothetical protein